MIIVEPKISLAICCSIFCKLAIGAKFISILGKYSVCILVPSHIQIQKSYVNYNEIQNQELLTLDAISPMWPKRLEESKLLSLLSLERLRLYLELKETSKCVVGGAYGFSSSYESSCNRCSKISWKFMFYFMIHSYSKLEETKSQFVKYWSEKRHYAC
jgi:hypothetical protein